MKRFHYQHDDIVKALRAVGVSRGDVLYSHFGLIQLGLLKELGEGKSLVETFMHAISEVLGPEGSFITPAFSYSFCKKETFDPMQTPSDVGAFGEQFRQFSQVKRSVDPLFSVSGIGPHVESLFYELPNTSFGSDCLYERLLSYPTKVCNFGLSLFYFTPIHHLERTLGVPYRFDKTFSGEIVGRGETQWSYYVRALCDNSLPDCTALQKHATEEGIVKYSCLGLGKVYCVPLKVYYQFASEKIKENPWYLAQGPKMTEEFLTEFKR